MTPKEKAKELFDKFFKAKMDNHFISITYNEAKQCALICVDEVLKTLWEIEHSFMTDSILYWEDVKKEINKL